MPLPHWFDIPRPVFNSIYVTQGLKHFLGPRGYGRQRSTNIRFMLGKKSESGTPNYEARALPEFRSGKTGNMVRCGALGLLGESDVLFHNRGDGTFDQYGNRPE
jgi:hypothetical protein